jgi:Reverse transcriptase (RNA-dependent DNA polymerase)
MLQEVTKVFVEYDSSESWRVYNLERKCFDVSHDVTFVETEFPVAGDFPGFGPTLLQQDMENPDPTRFLQNLMEPAAGRSRFAPSSVATDIPPVVHDMVVVEPPPAVQAMAVQSRVRLERNTEPANYHDAMMRMDADKWLNAMHTELQSLEDNNTWVLCELLRGRWVIGTKWVCKIKVDAMNILECYKARIVAQGFSQIAGLDFDETWAPVVRIESVRVLFALAALFDLWIIHIDAKTAFLNGDSDAELYVRQPEGFVDMRYPNHVLRLRKSLYGLKQAP